MAKKNHYEGVLRTVSVQGERVEFVRKRYKYSLTANEELTYANIYKRYPDRPGRGERCRIVNQQRRADFNARVKEAKLIASDVIALTDEWDKYPPKIMGKIVTKNTLRTYVAMVSLGWSRGVACAALGLSKGSMGLFTRSLNHIEDARDETWFDEFLTGIEDALQRSLRDGAGTSSDEDFLAEG